MMRIFKPKFHYTDFPVTSATSPRQTRDVSVDVSVTSPTSPSCRSHRRLPRFADAKRACCRLLPGIFQTVSTYRDGLKPRNFPVTRVMGRFRGSRGNEIWALANLSTTMNPSKTLKPSRMYPNGPSETILSNISTPNRKLKMRLLYSST